MKRIQWVVLVALVAALGLAVVALPAWAGAKKSYEQINWNKPKPIGERVAGQKYIPPEGWKEAVKGVAKIKVSNFGALEHDPATV